MAKKVVIKRISAALETRKLLEAYRAERMGGNSGQVTSAPSIALITGTGLAGKTTFLMHDVKPLVEELSRGSVSPFTWVHLSCDVDSGNFACAALFFELCERLEKERVSLPTCQGVLKKYNSMVANGLQKRFAERWNAFFNFVEILDDAASSVNELSSALSSTVRKIAEGIPGTAPLILPFLSALDNVSEVNGAIVGCASLFNSIANSLQSDGKGEAKRYMRKYERGQKCVISFEPLFDDLESDDLLAALPYALALDLVCSPKIACIAFDGVEGLMRAHNGASIPWLRRLISSVNAFYILAGRNTPTGLPQSRCATVALDRISAAEFQQMLGRKVVPLLPSDREILKLASDLPGLLSMYAQGLAEGAWSKGAEHRILGYKPSIFGLKEKHAPSVESLSRAMVLEYANSLRAVNGGNIWQLVATLSWLPEWNTDRAAEILACGKAHSELLDDLKKLPFTREIDPEAGLYGIHPSVASHIRAISGTATWHAVRDTVSPLLNDGQLSTRMAAATILLGVNAHMARGLLSEIDESYKVALPSDPSDQALRELFDSAADVIGRYSRDSDKAGPIDKAIDLLGSVVGLIGSRRDSLREIDTSSALESAVLCADLCHGLATICGRVHEGGLCSAKRYNDARLAEAEAQRSLGAIYSDQFRNRSDITLHLDALGMEIRALQTVFQIEKGTYDVVAKGKNANVAAGCINSVATSSYRIKRYDIGLCLSKIAKAMRDAPGSKVSDGIASYIANNYGSTRLSYVTDVLSEGMSYASPGDISLTEDGAKNKEEALDGALRAYREVINASHRAGRTPDWNKIANYAECCLLKGQSVKNKGQIDDEQGGSTAGWQATAMATCDGLKAVIEVAGQGKSRYMARCLLVRARVALDIARCGFKVEGGTSAIAGEIGELLEVKESPEATPEDIRSRFESAREDAVESLCLSVDLKGPSHVDVRKAEELIREIDDAVAESRLLDDDVKDSIKRVDLDKQNVALQSVSRALRPEELVMRIVRGDRVDLWDLFGLSEEEFIRRFDKALDGDAL